MHTNIIMKVNRRDIMLYEFLNEYWKLFSEVYSPDKAQRDRK